MCVLAAITILELVSKSKPVFGSTIMAPISKLLLPHEGGDRTCLAPVINLQPAGAQRMFVEWNRLPGAAAPCECTCAAPICVPHGAQHGSSVKENVSLEFATTS